MLLEIGSQTEYVWPLNPAGATERERACERAATFRLGDQTISSRAPILLAELRGAAAEGHEDVAVQEIIDWRRSC